jgi:methylated-DNA-protein-cysteine methyltransferase-like protein
MSSASSSSLYERIYALIALVPAGKVATYGDIAGILGTVEARTVGYALNALPAGRDEVPWQRIVNSQGGISTSGSRQRALLEAEGIVFDERGRIPLNKFRWHGPEAGSEPEEGEAEGEEQLSLF